MKQEVQVPEVGESVSGGILASWLKQSGDSVEEGDEIFELETDKATLAVPSPAAGTLEISVEEDAEVSVGQTVGYIDTEGAGAGSDGQSGGAAADTGAPAAEGAAEAADTAADAGDREGGAQDAGGDLSPAVRRIVAEHNLDPASIKGTGKDGRITKEDALRAAKEAEGGGKTAGAAAGTATGAGTATPTTGGGSGSAPGAGAKGAGDRPQRRVKMSTLRKRVAENLVASKQHSAHLTTFNEVDMSAVKELRVRYRDAFEKKYGVRLGFMSFFVKAAVAALQEFPEVNAFIDGEEIVYNDYYNIGVAVSTERGLIVPVVRSADRKSFGEIESEIISFGKRAQEKKLSPDELTGGTFTISNGGIFGSLLSTPIPNPPQTGVLGMHSIDERPVVVDGEIVIRPMMYVALTYDHRIIDGREAVRFLVKIKEQIQDPAQMLLEL